MDPGDMPDVEPEQPKAKRQVSAKALAALAEGRKRAHENKKAAAAARRAPPPAPAAAPPPAVIAAPEPAPKAAPAPAARQVTWDDFEKFKSDLRPAAMPAVAAPVVPAAPQVVKLSGSALLDAIFFGQQ